MSSWLCDMAALNMQAPCVGGRGERTIRRANCSVCVVLSINLLHVYNCMAYCCRRGSPLLVGIKSSQHVVTDSVPVVFSRMGKGMYVPATR